MKKNYFYCNQEYDDADAFDYLNVTTPKYTIDTYFYMNTVYNVSSDANEFSKCAISEYGGVFYLFYSPFYDYWSTFEGNSGVAGAITCEGCTMNLYLTQF